MGASAYIHEGNDTSGTTQTGLVSAHKPFNYSGLAALVTTDTTILLIFEMGYKQGERVCDIHTHTPTRVYKYREKLLPCVSCLAKTMQIKVLVATQVLEREVGMEGQVSSGYIARCHATLKEMGAPLMDWECAEVVDHGEDNFTCELCDCKKVRYIHVMRHDDWPDALRVGCICAGVMEGDILAAKERDAAARRRSQRKSHYLGKRWDAIGEGVWKTNYKHRVITIERDSFRGHEYYVISMGGECYQWKENRRMTSFLAAQYFVFDLIEWEEAWRKT